MSSYTQEEILEEIKRQLIKKHNLTKQSNGRVLENNDWVKLRNDANYIVSTNIETLIDDKKKFKRTEIIINRNFLSAEFKFVFQTKKGDKDLKKYKEKCLLKNKNVLQKILVKPYQSISKRNPKTLDYLAVYMGDYGWNDLLEEYNKIEKGKKKIAKTEIEKFENEDDVSSDKYLKSESNKNTLRQGQKPTTPEIIGKGSLSSGDSKLEETSNSSYDILKEDNDKSRILKKFFEKDCYLYVFDQVSADSEKNKKELDHYPSIDALVLKRDKVNPYYFNLNNIDGNTGEKRNYKGGVIEWGDSKRDTFIISFKKHQRNLYLRFSFTKVKLKVKVNIILGKFIFTQSRNYRVVSGSAILYKGEKISPKRSYNFTFRYKKDKDLDKIPPTEVQNYLLDKFNNWQKTPDNIFNLKSLDEWLKEKLKEQYTKKDIILYDYLISYPVSSLDEGNKDNHQGRVKLFPKIEKVLQERINPSSKIKSGVGNGKVYDSDSIRLMNKFLYAKYDKDINKTKVLIYPEYRINDPSRDNETNQAVNLEFFTYIRRAFNIIFIIPRGSYIRPSSVHTFIGYCVALKKRVLILCEDKKKTLPIVLQKDCSKLDIFVKSYETIEDIPFRVNEVLGGLSTKTIREF